MYSGVRINGQPVEFTFAPRSDEDMIGIDRRGAGSWG